MIAIDSFGQRLKPWVAEHFGRTEFHPGQRLPYELIDQLGPDVVVLQVAERFLGGPLLLRQLLTTVPDPPAEAAAPVPKRRRRR